MTSSNTRPRILHVDNSTAVTGAYKALLSWCLSTPEYDHVWVLPKGSAVVPDARKHFTVHELPFVEIGRSAGKLLGYLPALLQNGRRMARLVDRERIDLLHANDLYNLTPYLARKWSRRKPRLLVHARMLRRSFPGRIYDFWVRWHLRRADGIVAVSEAIRRDWGGAAAVQLAYDPIILQEALPEFRFEKRDDEPFRFLYLANYINGKGQDDAIAAITKLRQDGVSGFQVDFYGGTMGLEKNEAYRAGLQAEIDRLQLGDLVTIHHATDTVEAVMKSHHALLHFSHAESFGMVCYEALYYGLPVISSDCGGPAEMMEPGRSGLLRPVGDVAGFAEDMRALMTDPERCRRMAIEARRFVQQRFGAAENALSAVFRKFLS